MQGIHQRIARIYKNALQPCINILSIISRADDWSYLLIFWAYWSFFVPLFIKECAHCSHFYIHLPHHLRHIRSKNLNTAKSPMLSAFLILLYYLFLFSSYLWLLLFLHILTFIYAFEGLEFYLSAEKDKELAGLYSLRTHQHSIILPTFSHILIF